uniref:Uncharacterized protein n=1 Tax=Onchocerca volvulus TaxID=6282 RepID=A0A8R1XMV5_ONCVO
MLSMILGKDSSSLCFLTAESQILNLDGTYSLDNYVPKDCNGASFINTDGTPKRCTYHSDCHDVREPIYWCRLASNQLWTNKDCHCDPVLKTCIIERITLLGPVSKILNYAYCTPKASWYCP